MIQSWLDEMFTLEAIEHHIYPDSCGIVFVLISGYPVVPEGRGNRSEFILRKVLLCSRGLLLC